MTIQTYKKALRQAEAHLKAQKEILARAQKTIQGAEQAIMDLRQTIASLRRLCGEPELIEEDALGLTDAIRQVFRTAGRSMSAHDVREQMEATGHRERWANLLAGILVVIPRLARRGEIRRSGTVNGRDVFDWVGKSANDRIDALNPEKTPPSFVPMNTSGTAHKGGK